MAKQSDLQRAVALITVKIDALVEARTVLEDMLTATAKIGRKSKPKAQEGS